MKEIVGRGNRLVAFDLACSIIEFVELFWNDWKWHEEFVKEVVHESIVSHEDWSKDNNVVNDSSDNKDVLCVSFSRLLETNHPLPISLPWLPVHVANSLKQTIKITYCSKLPERFYQIEIFEESLVKGIPLIDPKVCTHWVLKEFVNDHDEDMLNIKIYLSFEGTNPFNLITPLVHSHSKTELTSYFKYWRESAEFAIIEKENDNIFTDSHEPKYHNANTKNDNDNKLKEIISIINELQFFTKKPFRKTIDDTELHYSNGLICGGGSNTTTTNSNDRETGFFSIFNNIFCSNA